MLSLLPLFRLVVWNISLLQFMTIVFERFFSFFCLYLCRQIFLPFAWRLRLFFLNTWCGSDRFATSISFFFSFITSVDFMLKLMSFIIFLCMLYFRWKILQYFHAINFNFNLNISFCFFFLFFSSSDQLIET